MKINKNGFEMNDNDWYAIIIIIFIICLFNAC